ncbi:MAG: YebC/PmpR family DNA-binding transcriptional regulator, partial [Actinomycetes bacterium]
LTDNRNRTTAEVKNIFNRNGGSIAEPGSVAWQFERKGLILVGADATTEDDLMTAALDAGAEDIAEQAGSFTITTAPSDVLAIRAALEEAGVAIESADTTMVASTSIELADEGSAKQVLRVIDALEDHDDVQGVYANFDIPESVLEAVMG